MATLARWERKIVDDAGNVVPGATVEVRREVPGQPLVPLFSDRDGLTPITNPFTADGDGKAAFHCPGGAFRIAVTKDAFSDVRRHVGVGTASEFDAVGDTLVQQVSISAVGTFAERDDFDDAPAGFVYLSTDGDGVNPDPVLFFKQSAANADWSDPVPFDSGSFIQAGVDSVPRTNLNKMRWRVDAEDFGDVDSNARDSIDKAIGHVNSVGGGEVRFEARQYDLDQEITLRSGVRLVGKGPGNSILRLNTNANTCVIKTLDFDLLVGGNSTDGASNFGIVGLTVDGNKNNQNGAGPDFDGIAIYGFKFLIDDVVIQNPKGIGLFSEWSTAGEPAMEATIRRLRIDTCGRHGMLW
jgi:hypothetical protein